MAERVLKTAVGECAVCGAGFRYIVRTGRKPEYCPAGEGNDRSPCAEYAHQEQRWIASVSKLMSSLAYDEEGKRTGLPSPKGQRMRMQARQSKIRTRILQAIDITTEQTVEAAEDARERLQAAAALRDAAETP